MNKIYSLLLLVFAISVHGQKINEIIFFQKSGKAIINLKIEDTFVSIDTDGKLLNLSQSGDQSNTMEIPPNTRSFSVNADTDFDYPNRTLISSSFNQKITYYNDFYDYQSGKLEKVNDLKFSYYNGFHHYQKGKIESIGDLSFSYYSDFYSYLSGKISTKDGIEFEYFNDFYKNKTGKLKSIKGNSKHIKITVIND